MNSGSEKGNPPNPKKEVPANSEPKAPMGAPGPAKTAHKTENSPKETPIFSDPLLRNVEGSGVSFFEAHCPRLLSFWREPDSRCRLETSFPRTLKAGAVSTQGFPFAPGDLFFFQVTLWISRRCFLERQF